MMLNKFPYVCHECKKIAENVEELLFVEDGSSRSFCSEDCIEEFYSPMIIYYDNKIKSLRDKMGLSEEVIISDRDDDFLVEEVSQYPDEVWKLTSDLKEEIFFHIKRHKSFYLIIVCTHFNQVPSFIYNLVKTSSKELLNEFRVGEKLDLNKEAITNQEISESVELLEYLDGKKSSVLSEILTLQGPNDIPFEDFLNYENSLNETLTNPDEIYEFKDRDRDQVVYYLKSFVDVDLGSYFYIVLGLKKKNSDEEYMVYPYFSFPTNDPKLYQQFRKGNRVLDQVKN